ncbi:hypothetical protein B0T24DRAFT_528711 [Lasiosphaeria ovina]|uniref:LPXTG-domain-containing protein n=1 Tax=Lasiosphaeria ovina TaxID=92902 RepID=A0AAE0KBM8_9PEZI|nr:hypothetical protein B0T24DRAFT_528711 [Lasiosphaeria ovina]
MLTLITLLVTSPLALALQVTPNSPCSSVCMDQPDLDQSDPTASNTKNSDIVCQDGALAKSATGTKWQTCMTCLQTSTFSKGGETDQGWFLYNMRYSVAYCIFGYPNATGLGSNPCSTSTACGPLQDSMQYGLVKPNNLDSYSYCSAGDGEAKATGDFERCGACVTADGSTDYLANYVVALEAGCQQQPAPGKLLGLSGTVFTHDLITVVDPLTLKSADSGSGLSTTVIVGLVVAGVALVLIIAGCVFICCRRRKNKRARMSSEADFYNRFRHRSSLSFKCQTHMASPITEEMPHSDMIDAVFQSQQPGDLGRRSSVWKAHDPETAFQDITHAPAYPQQESTFQFSHSEKAGLAKQGGIATAALPQITTDLPSLPPHAYTSPKAVYYSPSDIKSPMSALSTRSTTGLLPAVQPYVPADHGMLATPQAGNTFTPPAGSAFTSPVSASPSSPLVNSYTRHEPRRQPSIKLNLDVNMLPPPVSHKTSRYSFITRKSPRTPTSPAETWEIQTTFAAPPKR